jgi:inner membrane protein involved in colicin E2 resistance
MSFSAPISLGFFMVWIFVIGVLKRVEVHPVNHLFLAAAFFAFHLLFGYLADHLAVEWTFAISAAVSVLLVTTYLRLVVGARFAFLEAGLAQILYLVGFSLAHFWEGYTGLTVTVLGILTLFLLMQLTGRIRWAEVLAGTQPRD